MPPAAKYALSYLFVQAEFGLCCPLSMTDALARTLQAADIAGIRAMIVHAKDDAARRFYEHFDFDPSPTDPYHLYLLIKDLRKLAR